MFQKLRDDNIFMLRDEVRITDSNTVLKKKKKKEERKTKRTKQKENSALFYRKFYKSYFKKFRQRLLRIACFKCYFFFLYGQVVFKWKTNMK